MQDYESLVAAVSRSGRGTKNINERYLFFCWCCNLDPFQKFSSL